MHIQAQVDSITREAHTAHNGRLPSDSGTVHASVDDPRKPPERAGRSMLTSDGGSLDCVTSTGDIGLLSGGMSSATSPRAVRGDDGCAVRSDRRDVRIKLNGQKGLSVAERPRQRCRQTR